MEPQLPPASESQSRPIAITAGARHTAPSAAASPSPHTSELRGHAGDEVNIPDRYELLLGKISRAEREFEAEGVGGRSLHLEEASSIVFDLLYSLDFKSGGELVPRLAGLYGYIANELLNVGRTRDKAQLAHLRDMITTLRQSWYGAQSTTPAQR
jgi:flagellar biosynthetic protein FliS